MLPLPASMFGTLLTLQHPVSPPRTGFDALCAIETVLPLLSPAAQEGKFFAKKASST